MKTKNYICPLVEVAVITENLMAPSNVSNSGQTEPGGGVYDSDGGAPARRLYL